MDRKQQTNDTKSTQQTIPTSRNVPKTAVRHTKASMARQGMAQKQKQKEQEQHNNNRSTKTLIPRDSNKPIIKSRYSLPIESTKTSSTSLSKIKTAVTNIKGQRHSLPASSKVTSQPRSTTSSGRQPTPTKITKQQVRKPIGATGPSRPLTTATKRKQSLSNTTKEPAKKRPSWDHRGKLKDMEVELENAKAQLDGLNKFKQELLVIKEDKESERKQVIQRTVGIQSEIEILEKNHEQDVESMIAEQEIYHKSLQDQHTAFQEKESKLKDDMEEAERACNEAQNWADQVMQEHQNLKMKLGQVTTDTNEKRQDIDRLEKKLERYGGTLIERERDISELKVALDKEQIATDLVHSKLKETLAGNQRIQDMVDKLLKD